MGINKLPLFKILVKLSRVDLKTHGGTNNKELVKLLRMKQIIIPITKKKLQNNV